LLNKRGETVMKVLVIGFGSIGHLHTEILSAMEQVERVDLVTKQEIADLQTWLSLEAVPDLNIYDFFLIASETWKHYKQLKFLESHVSNKIILVEKPLFSAKERLKIENNRVFVAYNLRFHPVIKKIRNWLQGKRTLSTSIVVGQYLPTWRPAVDYRTSYSAFKEKGGGVLLDLSHELDYIQWLFGEVIMVDAISRKISNLEIDSDDYLTMIGTTDDGVHLNLTMDYISKITVRQILIHTDESTIKADLIEGSVVRKKSVGELETVTLPEIDRNTTYTRMHQDLLAGKFDIICTFEEGVSIMNLIEQIRDSSSRKEQNDVE
jgi:predicted dehydrogenase